MEGEAGELEGEAGVRPKLQATQFDQRDGPGGFEALIKIVQI